MHITLINRPKIAGNFSFENILNRIEDKFEKNHEIKKVYLKGFFDIVSAIKIRRLKTDAYHITGGVNFVGLFLPKRKLIITVHDIGYHENIKHSKLKKFIYGLFWFSLPLRRAARIICVSEFTKQKILEQFEINASKVHVIYNPISESYYRQKVGPKIQSPLHIVQIGSGDHKNISGLIKASKDLPVHLHLIGKQSAHEVGLLSEVKCSYTTYFDITEEEVIDIYNKSDVLYFASFYEGFGMPIIEAHALGIPVITSHYGAMEEVSNGASILVNPYNIEEIRAAIQEIIDKPNLCKDLREKGYLNAQRFRAEAIAQKYEAVYNGLQ